MSDLAICKFMGWTLEYVRALDRDVRAVLIDEINHVNKPADPEPAADSTEDW